MRRRAKFSWEAHWREAYATGEIDLPEFERLIVDAIRAERAPKQERETSRTAGSATARWTASAATAQTRYAEAVGSWTQVIESGAWVRPSKGPSAS